MCTSSWPGKSSVSTFDQAQDRKLGVADVEEGCSYNLVLFLLGQSSDQKSKTIIGVSMKTINSPDLMGKPRNHARNCKAPQELATGGGCYPTQKGWKILCYPLLTATLVLLMKFAWLWNKNFAVDISYTQQYASKIPSLLLSSILSSWTYCSGYSGLLVKLTHMSNTVPNSTPQGYGYSPPPKKNQWLWISGDRERREEKTGSREFYRKSEHSARCS